MNTRSVCARVRLVCDVLFHNVSVFGQNRHKRKEMWRHRKKATNWNWRERRFIEYKTQKVKHWIERRKKEPRKNVNTLSHNTNNNNNTSLDWNWINNAHIDQWLDAEVLYKLQLNLRTHSIYTYNIEVVSFFSVSFASLFEILYQFMNGWMAYGINGIHY